MFEGVSLNEYTIYWFGLIVISLIGAAVGIVKFINRDE